MFGLKFILQTYHISASDLAQEMNINRANVSMWTTDRRIPEQKIEFLASKFPRIPKEFFSKELSAAEQLLVQEIYFSDTDTWDEIEEVVTDEEGNEYVGKRQYSHHQGIIEHLHEEYEKESLLERINEVISNNAERDFYNKKIVNRFVNLMESEDNNQMAVLKMVLTLLKPPTKIDFGGIDPAFTVSKKYSELYVSLRDLLEQYGIINQDADKE